MRVRKHIEMASIPHMAPESFKDKNRNMGNSITSNVFVSTDRRTFIKMTHLILFLSLSAQVLAAPSSTPNKKPCKFFFSNFLIGN